MSTAKNLKDAINEGHTLDQGQQDAIYGLVAGGCRQATKEALERRLGQSLSLWSCYGRYERVELKPGGAEYSCGQSWTDEMRELRNLILGKS